MPEGGKPQIPPSLTVTLGISAPNKLVSIAKTAKMLRMNSEASKGRIGFWADRQAAAAHWQRVRVMGPRRVPTEAMKARSRKGLEAAWKAIAAKSAAKRQAALAAELGWNERFPGSLPAEPVAAPAGTPEELRKHFGMVAALGLLSSSPWQN